MEPQLVAQRITRWYSRADLGGALPRNVGDSLHLSIGKSPVELDPDLRERNWGNWEGLTGSERDRVEYVGEAPGEHAERVLAAVRAIAERHPGVRIVVVTHGGVIGEVLANATGARGFAFIGADNASISHIVVEEDRITVRRFNDTTHLDPHFSVAAPPPI